MPSKLNSEFNYRTQVIGETPWEKIKTLLGFLEGRYRAKALEEVGAKKFAAKKSKLEYLRKTSNLEHEILELEAEIIETESVQESVKQAYILNLEEIEILKKLLSELYEIAEPTRLEGYTDDQMFEHNAANEFTVWVAKEIHAEILANGRPSPAKIRNAMSSPQAWEALQEIGLVPKGTPILGNDNPSDIKLIPRTYNGDIVLIENRLNVQQ